MDLEKIVYDYHTKNEHGFTELEMEEFLKSLFPDINIGKYNEALIGITCMMIDEEIVIYRCDVLTALRCGVENRDMRQSEFD